MVLDAVSGRVNVTYDRAGAAPRSSVSDAHQLADGAGHVNPTLDRPLEPPAR
jgi:hypothetical protein